MYKQYMYIFQLILCTIVPSVDGNWIKSVRSLYKLVAAYYILIILYKSY